MAETTTVAASANAEEVVDLKDVEGTENDLRTYEEVVEAGLDSFMAVGQALAEISNRKLYKLDGFATFEEYARSRWNLDRSFAYKQIRASAAVKVLSAHFDSSALPRNEAQARELTTLDKNEEHVVEAWGAALETAHARGAALPTAAEVRAAVTDIKRTAQLTADSGSEDEEESPEKVYNRAVKSFPRIWTKLEDIFTQLRDLPMRAVSVVVATDESANITRGDVETLLSEVNDWGSEFLADFEAYEAHRAEQAAAKKAHANGKAKVAGKAKEAAPTA